MSNLNRYIGISILFAGFLLLLGCALIYRFQYFTIGNFAYQSFWLGYTAMIFVVCSLIYCYFVRDEKYLSAFYILPVWALILIGSIEAIWGLRQILGFSSSNHSYYLLTGSFYNPGPYSGYLAMVFPVCLSEWLIQRNNGKRTWVQDIFYYILSLLLLLILCILPVGMSRSAWIATLISGLWVYGIHNSWITSLKNIGRKYGKKMILVLIVGILILLLIGYVLFHLKMNSAYGRLFMWKISCMAIAESPLTGHGSGSFVEAYGEAQEKYFAHGDFADWEELVAGSPEYAFNEYLKIAIEYGIPILILILIGIGFCLWRGRKNQRYAACGGIISFMVFAFSSYPLQIPGFTIAFVVLLVACTVCRSKWSILLSTLVIAVIGGYNVQHNRYTDFEQWMIKRMFYNVRTYEMVRKEYEKLYPVLKDQGAFLFEYGYSMYKLEEYEASNKILKEAIKYSSDPMVLNIIGKNYQGMKKYKEAEHWFLRSTHRLPGRIYPYFLLTKLYADPEFYHPEQLQLMANKVLTKEPKVQSTAVREMRTEVRKIMETIKLQ